MEHSVRQPLGQSKNTARNKVQRHIPGSGLGDGPQYGSNPSLSGVVPKDEAVQGMSSSVVPPYFPPPPPHHHHHSAMIPPPGIPPLPTPNISLPMPPLLPPPPLTQPFGPSQQQSANLGELLMTTNALPELIQKVHDLGFPGSCQFVLGLLERYFSSCFAGNDPMATASQIARSNLLVLKEIFILHQQRGRSSSSLTHQPPLSPTEEMCMLMSLYNHLEELPTLEFRYCVFDAVFSAVGFDSQTGDSRVHVLPVTDDTSFNYLKKLVSLSINIESIAVLTCAALWMQTHPTEALLLANSLYYEFCVLIPDAMEPLLKLAVLVPYLANQMTIAFTSLYPFHLVGADVPPGVNPAQLHPPIKLLQIVSHWLETSPSYLYATSPLGRNITELPLMHSRDLAPTVQSISRSPLAGIIQWCILAPLSSKNNGIEASRRNSEQRNKIEIAQSKPNSVMKLSDQKQVKSREEDPESESLFSALHASLLSVVISRSSSTQGSASVALSRDDVAIIVAALLGFEQHAQGMQRMVAKSKMDECVERLAQFMQIGLSNGMVKLSPEDLASVASTLPKNRLLELVVAHSRQTGLKKS